jgi:hypothetical protein
MRLSALERELKRGYLADHDVGASQMNIAHVISSLGQRSHVAVIIIAHRPRCRGETSMTASARKHPTSC